MASDETRPLPEFQMPRCHKHFFTHNRWWCKNCRRLVETEFADVCNALWALQRVTEGTTPTGSDGGTCEEPRCVLEHNPRETPCAWSEPHKKIQTALARRIKRGTAPNEEAP